MYRYRGSDLARCRFPTALLTRTWLVAVDLLFTGCWFTGLLTLTTEWSWWIDCSWSTDQAASAMRPYIGHLGTVLPFCARPTGALYSRSNVREFCWTSLSSSHWFQLESCVLAPSCVLITSAAHLRVDLCFANHFFNIKFKSPWSNSMFSISSWLTGLTSTLSWPPYLFSWSTSKFSGTSKFSSHKSRLSWPT